MTMKCAYSSDEVPRAQRTAGRWLGIACELVDVKPRKQIICNPRCEREIKLTRLKLKRNSFLQFLINLQNKNPWL